MHDLDIWRGCGEREREGDFERCIKMINNGARPCMMMFMRQREREREGEKDERNLSRQTELQRRLADPPLPTHGDRSIDRR